MNALHILFRRLLALAVAVEVGLLLNSPHGLNHARSPPPPPPPPPPLPPAGSSSRTKSKDRMRLLDMVAYASTSAGRVLPVLPGGGCHAAAGFNLLHPGLVGWAGVMVVAGCHERILPLATATGAVAVALSLLNERAPALCLVLAVRDYYHPPEPPHQPTYGGTLPTHRIREGRSTPTIVFLSRPARLATSAALC